MALRQSLARDVFTRDALLRGPVLCWAVATIATILLVLEVEPDRTAASLVLAFLAGVCGLVFALTRRLLFSFAIVTLVFVAVYAASAFKFRMVAMNLHVYDIAFYLFNLAQISFFRETYPGAALGAGLGIGAGALALGWLWFRERPRALGRAAFCLCALGSVTAASVSTMLLVERGAYFFNDRESIFSAFVASLGDAPALMRARGVFEISAQAGLSGVALAPIVCQPQEAPPDIVLFLNESVMPPGVYPQIAYPPETKAFFESFDGRSHGLRVETFGGGTWLSDFSALTGLSTNMFGSMRNFAAQLTAGRLRHSLPQYLKACGYDTTLIYPSLAEFAGSARFYRAIGFDKVIDRQAHHAPDERQRDAFYYDQVRQVFDRARAQENHRPQFIVASSMATHSPWNFRFAPEAMKPGDDRKWTGDPEMDEYLWRLTLAKRDRDAFRADLAKSYPGKPFLFVGYGDHQPAMTRLPLENANEIAETGRAWQLDPTSRAFETYYSIEGLGFAPRISLPNGPVVEIPHLATLAVAAAGLPLDPVYERRWWLMQTCRGLYTSCQDKGAVMAFQRWMADAGWMAQR